MPAERREHRDLVPVLVLLISLLLTAAAAYYAHESGDRQDGLRFERTAEVVRAEIGNRLESYIAMLLGGAGLFAASDDVTREEFAAYVSRLELSRRYPGIQGIGFSRVIHPGEEEALLASARRAVPEFRFWPEPAGGDFNAILYLEPLDSPNRHALGFDMGSEAVRREAMQRARDTGNAAASRKVRLVQEEVGDGGPDQAGFLIYVPVYRGGVVPATTEARRASVMGYVYSPFRADDLLQGILGFEVRTALGLEVFDGDVHEGHLLHRTRPASDTGLFQARLPVEVGGRTWAVVVSGGAGFASPGNHRVVVLIAGGGVALSLLLFLVVRTEVAGRARAERTAEDLRRSEEKLRALDQEKDAFLAIVSHELRTPLNAIVGWASMLGREAVSPETQAHAIEVIKRNAAAQARLIEDLLDMSRAVTGHLDLRLADVDVRAVLGAAVDSVRPAAEQAGLTLDVQLGEGLGILQADPGRLHQIVVNILSNAIKFTPPGGHVRLEAERSRQGLQVRVTDTGIGIEPGFRPYVFDRFRQADSSPTRAHSGAGLGLAITRHLVGLHGGTIEAESAGLNAGATFTVRLPPAARKKPA